MNDKERLDVLVEWIDAHQCHDCAHHGGCEVWHGIHVQLDEVLTRIDRGDNAPDNLPLFVG